MAALLAVDRYMTCTLNGVDLAAVDDRVFIEEITEEPHFSPEMAKKPTTGSLMINQPGRDTMQIRLQVYVKERDLAERMNVIRKVSAWAVHGGMMTCGHRKGQQIYVECVSTPKASVWDTRQRLEYVFMASESYWRGEVPVSDEDTGTSLSFSITPKGDIDCPLEAEVTAAAAVTSVTLSAGGKSMAFTGLSLSSGDVLKILYDKYGFLTAKVGTTSYLGYRSAESADDIWLTPNAENTVTATADGSCTVKVIARGVYL